MKSFSKSIRNSTRFKNTVPVHCTVWCGINREMHLVHSRRDGGWINNKQISRNCKRHRLFNYPFLSKGASKTHDKETLMGLCKKLRLQRANERTLVSGQRKESIRWTSKMYYPLKSTNFLIQAWRWIMILSAMHRVNAVNLSHSLQPTINEDYTSVLDKSYEETNNWTTLLHWEPCSFIISVAQWFPACFMGKLFHSNYLRRLSVSNIDSIKNIRHIFWHWRFVKRRFEALEAQTSHLYWLELATTALEHHICTNPPLKIVPKNAPFTPEQQLKNNRKQELYIVWLIFMSYLWTCGWDIQTG